ncbi:MAG: hypothetical protein U0637_00370 [Phycisphaerales bacterium]
MRAPFHPSRAGITLVEAVLSMLVLAVLATAALAAVSQSRRARALVDEQSMGASLARSMLAEITALPYMEPSSTSIGVDSGESQSLRGTLDDVDDYNLYAESPCTTRDGAPVDGTDTWRRTVVVSWVPVSANTTPTGSDTGLKRVWVTVRHGDRVVARLSALRAEAWDDVLAVGGL